MSVAADQVQRLRYRLFESHPEVVHGTFARHGGVSKDPFSSLNLGRNSGDLVSNVQSNGDIVRKTLGLERIIYPNLVHGVGVERIRSKEDPVPTADALFTTEKGIGLGITHADCQAALFYDPVQRAVALAHCGWRGSVLNIYAHLIETLRKQVGSRPEDLLVCISPSLGPDHAEFRYYRLELPEPFWKFETKPSHFDFWAITKMQLTASGVLPQNIEIASICTLCDKENYFSHRRKDGGRNASVIGLI